MAYPHIMKAAGGGGTLSSIAADSGIDYKKGDGYYGLGPKDKIEAGKTYVLIKDNALVVGGGPKNHAELCKELGVARLSGGGLPAKFTKEGYEVLCQSTSNNRKIAEGTTVCIFSNTAPNAVSPASKRALPKKATSATKPSPKKKATAKKAAVVGKKRPRDEEEEEEEDDDEHDEADDENDDDNQEEDDDDDDDDDCMNPKLMELLSRKDEGVHADTYSGPGAKFNMKELLKHRVISAEDFFEGPMEIVSAANGRTVIPCKNHYVDCEMKRFGAKKLTDCFAKLRAAAAERKWIVRRRLNPQQRGANDGDITEHEESEYEETGKGTLIHKPKKERPKRTGFCSSDDGQLRLLHRIEGVVSATSSLDGSFIELWVGEPHDHFYKPEESSSTSRSYSDFVAICQFGPHPFSVQLCGCHPAVQTEWFYFCNSDGSTSWPLSNSGNIEALHPLLLLATAEMFCRDQIH